MAADEVSSLYLERGPQRLKRQLDSWLEDNLRPPAPLMAPRQQYEALVDELAPQYGQDPLMVKAMIQAESAWNPQAVSPAGAQGIAQFMPATARRFGVQDPFDPTQAIPGMLKYLKTLSDEFGDPVKVVAAYNAGEGAVRQYNGVPPYDETVQYVRKVFGGTAPQAYTSKRAGVGPEQVSSAPYELADRAQTALAAPGVPSRPSPSTQMLDTTIPALTPAMIDTSKTLGYTSKGEGEGLGPATFPDPQRFRPDLPGGALEVSLEEPTWQRVPQRVMQGLFGTLAGVSALPMTAGRLLGIPEREVEQLFPAAAGLRNSFREMAQTFDPVGTEENIVDRFAQTLGQQIVFFGSGALAMKGAQAIEGFAPAIGRALGAGTAAVQEAGMEAQETMDRLTPLIGEEAAAQRANTVFWRNVAVLGLTNRLGVFSEAAMPAVLKLSTAAAMEGFQEVVQYDVQRRQFWVPDSHPVAAQLQAIGWKKHGHQVYQPFDIGDAAEAGALGAVMGGAAHLAVDAAGRQVLPVATEQQVRKGLDLLTQVTGGLLAGQRGQGQPRGPHAQKAAEQQQLNAVRERIKEMEDSQVRDEEGRLLRMYHGTGASFASFQAENADPSALYGPGFYFTDSPGTAGEYARGQAFQTFDDPAQAAQAARAMGTEVVPVAIGGEITAYKVPTMREGGNVRPVYLDIKKPFDMDALVGDAELSRILAVADTYLGEGATDYLRDTLDRMGGMQHVDGTALYRLLSQQAADEREEPLGKAQASEILRQAGYDGITHTGGAITDTAPHRVYIAFASEQVIPAFALEMHPWFQSVLAYADRPTSEAGELTDTGVGVGTSVLGGQAGAINPLRNRTLFPHQPSPPPKQAPTIGAGATGIERGNFRDDQGRWRIPLSQMPSIELELQDLIRQQGGIRLEGEELRGELAALISRKETGLGGLQNNNGMTLQQMAETAQQLGFTRSADKTALLEAMQRSIGEGHYVYSDQSTGHIPLIHSPELVGIYQDIAAMAETLEAQTQDQRRGTRPRAQVHDEGRAFVESGGFTIDDVRELMPGTVLDDTTTSALVHTLGRVAAETGDLATAYIQKVEQGQTQPGAGSQEERDWLTAFGGVASTHPQRLGVMAEAGRSLGILNDPLSSTNQMLNMVGQLAQQAAGLDSYKLAQQYINLLQRAGGKEAVKFAQKAVTPGYGGMVLELYYQGMLSNPKTWLTNEVSNALTAAWALPVRLMAGVYSQTVGSGEITLGETAAYAYGLMHQVQRAWQLSGEAFTTGLPQYGKDIPGLMEPVGQGKATGPALTVANLQANGMPIDPNSPYGQLADFWFEWVGLASGGRLGTKIMLSRDEFYKTLNYGGELGALAYRKAMLEGSTSQEKFADTMARVLGEPLPEEMHLAANQHALIQTFQNEMMGAIGKMGGAIQNLSVDVPGLGPFPLGRMIMPFLHIAVNIPRYALENSPLGFFFKSVRDDIAAGGARGDMAMGKMLMGSLTAATFGLMASSGLITGRGPEDKDLRAAMVRAGWQPYSMYVPWLGQHGGYVSLQRLDPIVGQHAGIMADIIEAWGEQEVSMVERAVMGTAFAIISNIGSRSWMRGTSEFFDIMAPRSMRAFEGESKFEGLRGFARGQLSSLAPAVWSVVQKTSDPATKAAWDLADGFRQKVPGWAPLPESATAAALPNYRNKWGDKRLLGWGWSPDWLNWVEGFTEAISPLKVTTLVRDPLDRELLANQIRLSMPTRTLGIRGPQDAPGEGAEDAYAAAEAADPYAAKRIVLTSAQYERRVALAANNREAIQELGMTVNDKAVEQLRRDVGGHTGERLPSAVPGDLYSVLLWATTTKRYQEGMPGPQGDKEEILRRIDRDFRQFGDTQLMANDAELRQQYLTGKALQDLQRTPLPHRERLRGLQEQQLRREEERLRVGAPR